jgi:hypothetical protein
VTEAEPKSEEFIEIGRQLYFEGYSARLKDNWWLKELNGYFYFFLSDFLPSYIQKILF